MLFLETKCFCFCNVHINKILSFNGECHVLSVCPAYNKGSSHKFGTQEILEAKWRNKLTASSPLSPNITLNWETCSSLFNQMVSAVQYQHLLKINKLTTTSINMLAATAYMPQILSDLVIDIRQNRAAAYVGYIMNGKTLLICFAIFLLVLQKWKELLQEFYVSWNKENILHEFFSICLWLVLYVYPVKERTSLLLCQKGKKMVWLKYEFCKTMLCKQKGDFSFCFSIK